MGMTAEAYRDQFHALLPLGRAWPREPDSTLSKVLLALADEFARLDARAELLMDEAFPSTLNELLDEWEADLGLPGSCADDVAQTTQGRRDAISGKLTGVGGQSKPYFIELAAALGFTVTITHPQTHWWEVAVPGVEPVRFQAGTGTQSQAGDALRVYGDEIMLECLFTRYCPAHAVVSFKYGAAGDYTISYTKEVIYA